MPTDLDEAAALNDEMRALLETACEQRDRLATAAERIVADFEELNGSECKPSLGPCGQCIRCILSKALNGIPAPDANLRSPDDADRTQTRQLVSL